MIQQRLALHAPDWAAALSHLALSPIRALTSTLLLALTLAGCAGNPSVDGQKLLAPVPASQLSEARALSAKGDASGAAKYYLDLSEKAKPPTREQLRIEAAKTLLAAGQAEQAADVLDQTSQKDLTGGQQQIVLLLGAEAQLQLGHAQQAIARLDRVQTFGLPTDLRIQRQGILAAAYRVNGQPVQAAEALNELDGLIKDPKQRLANQVSLIHALGTLPATQLQQMAGSGSGDMRGWAELAVLFGSAGAADSALDQRYRAWRSSHGSHPAMAWLAEAYFGSTSGGYPAGAKVAVLLPSSRGFGSGAFGEAVGAIRDGIQAARGADGQATRPELGFVDAAGDSARALVDGAAARGAGYIIGPLQKGEVDTLAKGQALPVPTLALNRAGSERTPPANLFQYALSPEDEGASVAHTAWTAGHRSALLLYPGEPWADRLVRAFRDQWAALGGRIAGQKTYNAGAPDAAVQELLGSKQANAFVFLVASKDSARTIWPQIRAAGEVPTFATSLVYTGDFGPTQDAVLVGLNFVDIPWMLTDDDGPLSRRALRRAQPGISGSVQRLYAMGIDAYQLAPRAAELSKGPGAFYPGKTGGLRVDASGRVHRQLVLGRYTATGVALAASIGATD